MKLALVALVACGSAPAVVVPPVPAPPPPPVEVEVPPYEISLRIDKHGCRFTDGKGYEDEDLRVPRGAQVHLRIDVVEPAPCDRASRPMIVMEPAALAALIRAADELVTPTTPAGKVALGERLFQAKGCIVCHTNDGTPRFAPSWKGLWGTTVADAAGNQRTVDAPYLRESILAPQAFLVTGFPASMPSYEGVVNELEIESITAYIASLR